jgi:hypothetical protein
MSNDSSTGGYLAPAVSPAPLEGAALLQFFQQIIVGVTGLPGDLVRPYWQTEPPNVPPAGTAWCAFRVDAQPSDEYPFVFRTSANDGDHLQRHETLNMLATFYDLGSGGEADANASLLRDGLAIAQNREVLVNAGMGLVRAGSLTTVPVILKLRWNYRVDLELVFRRQIDRVYPVDSLVGSEGTVNTDTGLPPQAWSAPT